MRVQRANPLRQAILPDSNSTFRCSEIHCHPLGAERTWHYHPEYELVYVQQGLGTRCVGDAVQPFATGDLVLVGPNLPHCWHSRLPDGGKNECTLLVLQFLPSNFGPGFFQLHETKRVRLLLEQARHGMVFPKTAGSAIGPHLRQLMQSSGLLRVCAFLQVLDLLSRFPATPLAADAFPRQPQVNPLNRRRVEAVLVYVRNNLRGTIVQSEIAGQLGMNAPTFSRFFRQSTGMTFIAFVNALRTREACRRLSESEDLVTDIAMECGYSNTSHFNRQFLKLHGMSPSLYRDRIREAREAPAQRPSASRTGGANLSGPGCPERPVQNQRTLATAGDPQ